MLALSDHRESPLKRQNSRDRIRRLREIQALIPSGFLSRELLTQLAALSHNTRIIRGSSDTCGHNQTEKMLIATKKMRCQQHSYEALPGIENNLHWQLDVTFGEDLSRIRKGQADTNFSTLRRAALSLLKRENTEKVGIKNKRLTAAWDPDYLAQVLFGK